MVSDKIWSIRTNYFHLKYLKPKKSFRVMLKGQWAESDAVQEFEGSYQNMWSHMMTRAFMHRQSASNPLPQQRFISALPMQNDCVYFKSECQVLRFASFVRRRYEQIYLWSTITKAAPSIPRKPPVVTPAPLQPSQDVVHWPTHIAA